MKAAGSVKLLLHLTFHQWFSGLMEILLVLNSYFCNIFKQINSGSDGLRITWS